MTTAALKSDAILERLSTLHPNKIELGLERISRLLAALGRPEEQLPPVIHVAGTNGKGSTCAFARAMLEAQGLKVHVYTSPHLVRFHERIRVAGNLIGEDGLGGKYDATNVIARPAACVITPVGLDHQEFLGPSLAGIAAEKAGIIKP